MDSPSGNLFAALWSIPALVSLLSFSSENIAAAQIKPINSVGIVESFSFTAPVSSPVLFRHTSQRMPDLVWYDKDSSIFYFAANTGKGQFTGRKFIARSQSVSSFSIGNINDDGLDDLVIVHRDQNQVELLVSRKSDSSFVSSSFQVNFYPEQAVIGDLNNDRIADVMTYGKLSSGISFLQGRGNGKFLPFKVLFENIPASGLTLLALNGDNIVDIALHHWLTNETILFLGLGKLKFSEQTVLSFGEDSVQVRFLDVNDDHLTDVAISSAKDKTLQIMNGDGLGNFTFSQAIPIYRLPAGITTANFRSARSADLVLYDPYEKIFSLVLNKADGQFYDEIIYGMSSEVQEIIFGDLNGDKLTDILFFQPGSARYSILWNSQTTLEHSGQERIFAVGLRPSNLSVMDLNSDGRDDVVVCNERSSSVSLLLSTPNRSFSGQITLETPENPFAAALYAKSDSSVTLYSTHQDDPKISLITLRTESDSLSTLTGDIEQFSIPLPDKPTTVLPDVSYMEKGISLYAFMASSTNSIVFYQQVKGTRFLTRSLVPLIPSKIIYSTINDLNSDGKTDLVYVNSTDRASSTMFGITMNDSNGTFKGRLFTSLLSDSTNRKAFVLTDDFNGDQLKDVLVYTIPENILRIALGNKETTFGAFQPVSSAMSIKALEQIQLFDFDNDGNLDILYHDRALSELNLLRGKGNGLFFPSVRIASIPKESVFRCGDFNSDSAADIVYTNPSDATITVIYGN